MTAADLRALQAPIKDRYRADPGRVQRDSTVVRGRHRRAGGTARYLLKWTERYCVVAQTVKAPVSFFDTAVIFRTNPDSRSTPHFAILPTNSRVPTVTSSPHPPASSCPIGA
jgi:uncharacterized membrane protein